MENRYEIRDVIFACRILPRNIRKLRRTTFENLISHLPVPYYLCFISRAREYHAQLWRLFQYRKKQQFLILYAQFMINSFLEEISTRVQQRTGYF